MSTRATMTGELKLLDFTCELKDQIEDAVKKIECKEADIGG